MSSFCYLFVALTLGTALVDAIAPQPTGTDRVVLARVPHNGVQPQVLVDERGVLHMLYFAGEAANGNLFYVRSTDFGATFSAPVRVNSQDGSAIATGTIRGGHLALGRDGRVHVAWNGSGTAEPRLQAAGLQSYQTSPFLYTRSNRQGTAPLKFEPQRNLMKRTHSLDGGGTITADESGRVYAVWHAGPIGGSADESQRPVWISRSDDDGASFSPEKEAWTEPTGACGCCGLQALADPKQGLLILYRSATEKINRDIYLLRSRDQGRTFSGTRVHKWNLNACPMTSMALVARDRALAAWETAGQVYFGAIDPTSARIASPIAAPGTAAGRKHPRLAIAPNGDTLFVWTEGMAWARGGSLAWQRFDANGQPLSERGAAANVPVWSFAAVAPKPDGGFVIFY
jgi:hypothetical protein